MCLALPRLGMVGQPLEQRSGVNHARHCCYHTPSLAQTAHELVYTLTEWALVGTDR